MTHFNRIFLFFSTLLLFGFFCNARPLLEKRRSTVRELFDTRSHTPPAFGRPITNVAYNRQSLAGGRLEARTPEFSAPAGRVKKGSKNKTQARKARKALGESRPTPNSGFGRNGLTKGPACIIGNVNKCGVGGGATSWAAAKNAKQRPAGLSLTAKKKKKVADRKDNRQMAVKIKHQDFVKKQNAGQPNQKLQQWKIDPKTHVAQRAKTAKAIKTSWNGDVGVRGAYYKKFEKTGPSFAAKSQRLKESVLLKGKDPKREQYKLAKAAYDASIKTGTFPDRKATFKTPLDGVYKGKDVRQALFNAHLHDQPDKKVGYTADGKAEKFEKKKQPKEFNNYANAGQGGTVPLPWMTGKGREYTMMHDHALGYHGMSQTNTATRLITQEENGAHKFEGIISHPERHSDDHVEVLHDKVDWAYHLTPSGWPVK